VNLNPATETAKRTQLGLSPKTAAIIAWRKTPGPFTSVAQSLLVPISRPNYNRINDLVTI
jgi:DNA uptake protein ComE-like DNA-binding protein